MAKNGEKNRKMAPNPISSPFLGHFFPISGRGPFSIFWTIFSHFWISARFPFYTRRPESEAKGWGFGLFIENPRGGGVVHARNHEEGRESVGIFLGGGGPKYFFFRAKFPLSGLLAPFSSPGKLFHLPVGAFFLLRVELLKVLIRINCPL